MLTPGSRWLFFLLLLAIQPAFANPDIDEEAVIRRLASMKNEVVDLRYDNIVKSYLRTYTILQRKKAEKILGRTILYFPLFEDYLRQYDLPQDLKYLPVVESALEPRAISSSSAVGLWQFMEATGKYYGLQVTPVIDERCDPHKSTRAALAYLTNLYDRFGNWELAIAAYNSGGGRVSRAIKRARSTDYWKVRRFLPRETANYVPAFIAASYLLAHYEDHQLQPEYPSLDAQLTATITVYRQISFYEIAQLCDIPLDVIELLNPTFRQGYIPADPRGHTLTLPRRVIPLIETYFQSERPDAGYLSSVVQAPVYITKPVQEMNARYRTDRYTVGAGQSIAEIAGELGLTVHQLMAWNNLKSPTLRSGQQLILYKARAAGESANSSNAAMRYIPVFYPPTVTPQAPPVDPPIDQLPAHDRYIYYRVRERANAFEIADQLPGISAQDLIRLNELQSAKRRIRPGTVIRVKKL